MQRFNPAWFYRLGAALEVLMNMKTGEKISKYVYKFGTVKDYLPRFINDKIIPLNRCKEDGKGIMDRIEKLISTPDNILTEDDIEFFERDGVPVFEGALNRDLEDAPTFYVEKKGIFDISALIDDADKALADDIKASLDPKVLDEINKAGRCLAFDLTTAAGFHVMRAIEPLLYEWHLLAVGEPPKNNNWGGILDEINKKGGNLKLHSTIDEIREDHRNKIMHPEKVLTKDDAMSLFHKGIAVIRDLKIEIQKLNTRRK